MARTWRSRAHAWRRLGDRAWSPAGRVVGPPRVSPHPAFQQNVPLGGRTSLKTGGLAEWYAELSTTAEARAAMKFARERGLDFTVIGGGSNLLIADEGLAGLSVRFPAGRGHSIEDGQRGWVDAAAGSNLAGLARRLARAGWSGLEWAANVPG